MKVYLSLGSNLGDRQSNLDRALRLLEIRFGAAPAKVSGVMETPSQGFDGPDFLNLAVLYEIAPMVPESVLDICQSVEIELGRPAHEAEFDAAGARIYHPRTIDIDILYIDDLIVRTPRLTLPHPRMDERPFVQIPLSEILPQEK